MATEGEGIAEALESAIGEETEESPTSETVETQETKGEPKGEPGAKKGSKTIPYDRFQEVVQERNDFKSKIAELENQYKESNQALSKLTSMYEDAKESTDILDSIKELAKNPKYLPHLEVIDKALKGIEEEVEEGKTTPEDALKAADKILNSKVEELTEELAEQRADAIIARADAIADKWLASLPEEYTDKDKDVIARLWTNAVDWNEVEDNPSILEDTLKDSLQNVIEVYGPPRGSLFTAEEIETALEEETSPEKMAVSPEEELAALTQGKNYSSFKEVTVPLPGGRSKTTLLPEVSEDDFSRDLAEAMRIANRK